MLHIVIHSDVMDGAINDLAVSPLQYCKRINITPSLASPARRRRRQIIEGN